MLVSLIDAWNLPSVILECFWGTLSVYGLVRSLRRRDQGNRVMAKEGQGSALDPRHAKACMRTTGEPLGNFD